MLDRLRKLWEDRPTPVKDKIQAVGIKLFLLVAAASFIGSFLAKGCG